MRHKESITSSVKAKGELRPTSEPAFSAALENQNRQAVQLLRSNRFNEALLVLRSLVLQSGCTWMRPDVPLLVKRNFATALLLTENPSGCLVILAEINDDAHPRVQKLRDAIKQWEKTLSFWQWLNWRTGWIAPENHPVTIRFVPGELEEEMPQPDLIRSPEPLAVGSSVTSRLHKV